FSFPSSALPPALPSFPTRRSSDLYYRLAGEIGGAAGAQLVPRGGMASVVDALRQAAESAGATVLTGAPVSRILVEHGRATGVALDRKSTRLNSSHVKISYAVFCLK